jgi:hypothetical protein
MVDLNNMTNPYCKEAVRATERTSVLGRLQSRGLVDLFLFLFFFPSRVFHATAASLGASEVLLDSIYAPYTAVPHYKCLKL